MPFEFFLEKCVKLRSYSMLESHLIPKEMGKCIWMPEIYPVMEQSILQDALKFKTNFISAAKATY